MQIISAEIYLISVLHISTLMIYFYNKKNTCSSSNFNAQTAYQS